MGIAVLDIDGTLVDTNYQHALAWFRAFRQHGFVLPLWRIDRHIGMGGDQLVGSPGEGFDRELIEDLEGNGHTVVLAPFAKSQKLEHYLTLLDARRPADDWTDSSDVEATKPQPGLLPAALEKVGGRPKDAVMIGDSVWDCQAAKRARVRSIGALTGGFSEQELREAGASRVYRAVDELRQDLDASPLRV